MALQHSPRIVTDGLIFMIDAANPKCMQAGDTTCTDLIGAKTCTGASGTPAAGAHTPNPAYFPEYNDLYGGGVFDCAGGRGMNVEESLGSHTEVSVCTWLYKNSSSAQYITDGRNNGGTWYIFNYTSPQTNLSWANQLTHTFSDPKEADDEAFMNKWIYLVIAADASAGTFFVNDESVATGGPITDSLGVNFRIGTRYTTSAPWTGYMGPIQIYDRKITLAEVQQNFNAHRSRFGV